jgi:hypothetical protein
MRSVAVLPPPRSDEQACQNKTDGLKYCLNDGKAANRGIISRKESPLFASKEVVARDQFVILRVEGIKTIIDSTDVIPVA